MLDENPLTRLIDDAAEILEEQFAAIDKAVERYAPAFHKRITPSDQAKLIEMLLSEDTPPETAMALKALMNYQLYLSSPEAQENGGTGTTPEALPTGAGPGEPSAAGSGPPIEAGNQLGL